VPTAPMTSSTGTDRRGPAPATERHRTHQDTLLAEAPRGRSPGHRRGVPGEGEVPVDAEGSRWDCPPPQIVQVDLARTSATPAVFDEARRPHEVGLASRQTQVVETFVLPTTGDLENSGSELRQPCNRDFVSPAREK
jgi:hypothetical protein